ncbi:MAG: permease [Leeuwenhoekiella sp.]
MDLSLQKTITFLLFIAIGLLLKLKFKDKEELTGIKKIILNLALPATIFIALLGIQIELSLLLMPVLALALNIFLFIVFPFILLLVGFQKSSSHFRTAQLLMPSLAPGLSCFPFVLEFLGENYLAKAAMADLGNKVFVLIVLYLVAMSWYYKVQAKKGQGHGSKVKSLLKSLLIEPINIFIAVALILVFMGINLESMPYFLSETLTRLSLLMTPLVLLFIGLAVKIKKKQMIQILSLLALRAGVTILFGAALIAVAGIEVAADRLLLISFGLSACSFWPFAHLSAVDSLEENSENKTFNPTFGVNILAISFPFSVMLILGILSSGNTFANLPILLSVAGLLLVVGVLPIIIRYVKNLRRSKQQNEEVLPVSE